MIDRINIIIRAKNLTARQFAEEIGIQPSGMSHILNGRNKPSLDFVMKVINRYPEIDINWLMFGKGEMLERKMSSSNVQNNYIMEHKSASVVQPSLFENEFESQNENENRKQGCLRTNENESLAEIAESTESTESENKSLAEIAEIAESTESENKSLAEIAEIENGNPVGVTEHRQECKLLYSESPYNNNPVGVTQSTDCHQSENVNGNRKQSCLRTNENEYLDENRVDEYYKPDGAKKRILVEKKIEKIIVMYSDHSFSEYYPES